MPWVTLVDPLAGEKVGMLVEVDLEDGTTAGGLFTHKYLNQSVGWVPAPLPRPSSLFLSLSIHFWHPRTGQCFFHEYLNQQQTTPPRPLPPPVSPAIPLLPSTTKNRWEVGSVQTRTREDSSSTVDWVKCCKLRPSRLFSLCTLPRAPATL